MYWSYQQWSHRVSSHKKTRLQFKKSSNGMRKRNQKQLRKVQSPFFFPLCWRCTILQLCILEINASFSSCKIANTCKGRKLLDRDTDGTLSSKLEVMSIIFLMTDHQLDLTLFTTTLWTWPSNQFCTSQRICLSKSWTAKLPQMNTVEDRVKGFPKV